MKVTLVSVTQMSSLIYSIAMDDSDYINICLMNATIDHSELSIPDSRVIIKQYHTNNISTANTDTLTVQLWNGIRVNKWSQNLFIYFLQ